LYQDNYELKNLCIKNDGKYVCVLGSQHVGEQNAELTMYSKESIEKLTL
jgi:hypothetical protein